MYTIAYAINKVIDIIAFMIIVKVFMTWIPGATQSKIYDILTNLTDPIEEPIRSVLYRYINGPIDFTPIIVIFLLNTAQRLVWMLLL